jgi:hypothetical protein
MDLAQQVGAYVGAASFIGLAIFVPLFVSQARDIRRLRVWSDREPAAAEEAERVAVASARVAQQAAIARATGEAEATRAEVKAAAAMASPAERVAADRPATTRITAERPETAAEPAWRRWLSGGPNARQLVWIVAGVFGLGLAVALVSLQLTGEGDGSGSTPPPTVEQGGVVKADVEVAVLNATAVPGLAAKVGDDVETNGYALGAVTNSDVPAEDSQVLFERGNEDAANAVASDLGVQSVEPIDSDTSALADGADVVVIAGEDRAQL